MARSTAAPELSPKLSRKPAYAGETASPRSGGITTHTSKPILASPPLAPSCTPLTCASLRAILHTSPTTPAAGPSYTSYEDLLATANGQFRYPQIEEDEGASLCYTSVTTGVPKGVLYSHRSVFLHTFLLTTADNFAISHRDVVLPVVSMFHVNGWGLPYAASLTGSKLVLPGPCL